mmetsp:Transcript_13158/g.19349  ORF Transcript_13158/g.19349 Transcript_13158/m.19349 type:complete len:351 (-) Transcript_13158:111-1163(-)
MTTERNVDSEGKQVCARSLVIISTLSFLATGAAIITCGILANDSGWLDILNDAQFSWLRTAVFSGIIALGCVIIMIGLSGCVGATYRKRGFLVCYNVFLVLGLLLFGLIIGALFLAYDISTNWVSLEYPADNSEITLAQTFNEAYCYTETSRLCNDANIDQLSSVLNLDPLTGYNELIPDIGDGGVDALCSDSTLTLLDLSQIPNDVMTSIENACDEALSICSKFEKYEMYSSAASTFFAKQCPQENNAEVLVWCSNLIIHDEEQDPYTGPYGVCRSPFLNFWSDTTRWIGIVLVVFLLLLLAVVISTCVLSRRRPAFHHDKPERTQHRKQVHFDDDAEQYVRPAFAKAY